MENKEIKKLKNFEDNLNESILNENIKIGGHIYSVIKTAEGTVYAGKDGVLGYKDVLIPWNTLDTLYIKVKKGVI